MQNIQISSDERSVNSDEFNYQSGKIEVNWT